MFDLQKTWQCLSSQTVTKRRTIPASTPPSAVEEELELLASVGPAAELPEEQPVRSWQELVLVLLVL